MAQTTKENLKKYFETGDKPTQNEYAELIDAFRHVDDKLPITDVESLQASLDTKAAAATLLNHMNDSSIHGNQTLDGADIKLAYEAEADTNAFTDAEKQQVADGVSHRADSNIHVSENDKKRWNNRVTEYTLGEVLTPDMGEIIRCIDGSMFLYRGTFEQTNNTFTCADFDEEANQTPYRWKQIIAGVDLVKLTNVSPLMIAQDSTYNIAISGWNFESDMNIEIVSQVAGQPDLAVSNIVVKDQNTATFDVTSNNNLQNYKIKITTRAGVYQYGPSFQVATETVIIPNAGNWIVEQGIFNFSDGVVAPSDLNISTRRAYLDVIPADLDFELEFKYNNNVIAGTSSNGTPTIGLTTLDDLSFDFTDNISPLNVSFVGGSTPYVYGKYGTSFLVAGGYGIYGKIERNNGILTYKANTTYPVVTVRYTYPDVINTPLRIWTQLTAHAGLSDIKLTIKL